MNLGFESVFVLFRQQTKVPFDPALMLLILTE